MTTLAEGQWETPGGLVIGAGTAYKVSHYSGPGHRVRTADSTRPDGPGVFFGEEWPAENPWTIDLMVLGSSRADTLTKYETLCANWSTRDTEGFVGSAPLGFKKYGQVQRQTSPGRPRDVVSDLSTVKHNYIPVSLTFMAELPFEFSAAEHVTDLVRNGSNVTLGNAGNYPAPVTWDVYGQVTNPGVIRSEADRFDLATAIGDLDYYRVRTEAKTVTRASDGHSLYQTWVPDSVISGSGVWLEIPAGGALFRAVGSTPVSAAVKVRATWRDTWWS